MTTGERLAIVGARIRALRESRGLTQEALGAAVGADQSLVSRWERGRTPPSVETLLAIGEVCDVDPGVLLAAIRGDMHSATATDRQNGNAP